MMHKLSWLKLGVVGLAGVLIAACSGANTIFNPVSAEPTALPVVTKNASIVAEARVVPSRFVSLAFPAGGRIAEIGAVEGANVAMEDVLARQDGSEKYTAALRSAELEQEAATQALDAINIDAGAASSQAAVTVAQAQNSLMTTQKALADTQTRDFRNRLDDRETIVQDRKETLDDRKTDLDKYTNLDSNNATRVSAQDSYDAALEEYNNVLYERDLLANQSMSAKMEADQANQFLKKAQRELDKFAAGPNPDTLAHAQKRLDAATAQVEAVQSSLDDLNLVAPFGGQVAEIRPIEAGGVVSAGQTVMVLADTSAWYVETTDMTEIDVVEVQVGDVVTIQIDALPESGFNGEVVSIAQNYTEKSGDVLYKVRILCDNPPEGLRWGMTANVSFGSR